MKVLQFFVVNLAFLFAFQISSAAQQKPVSPTKIGSIFSEKFEDASAGIKDIIAVNKKLEQEFRSQEIEIKILYEKHKNLIEELKRIAGNGGHPSIAEKTLNGKIEGVNAAFCKLESKTQIARANFEKRRAFLLSGVNKDISELLKIFGKEKGFVLIIDGSQKNNSVIIEGEIIDITNEFIQFYNSKTEKK